MDKKDKKDERRKMLKSLRTSLELLTGKKYKYNPEHFKGGYKMTPVVDQAGDVLVLDFVSFYPMIAIQNDLFGANVSVYLKRLFDVKSDISKTKKERSEAKLKLNSVYGMMKHFDFDAAKRCAEIGRDWIQKTISYFNLNGYKVLTADTDSITLKKRLYAPKIRAMCDEVIQMLTYNCKERHPGFDLCIENEFKFIYFFKNAAGELRKSCYIGIRDDEERSICMKSIRPSYFEQIIFYKIAELLRRGTRIISQDEFGELIDLIKSSESARLIDYSKIETFINTEQFTILRMEKKIIRL